MDIVPHYYSHKNTDNFGNVMVIPKEWYRRILFGGTFSPIVYKVNDVIKFKLYVDKFSVPASTWDSRPIVYERMGDGSIAQVCDIRDNETFISGRASYTGDTKFFLAMLPALHHIEQINTSLTIELFDEDVRSLNAYMFGWVGIIVSALLTGILSCCVGIFLSLVVIRPFWEAWIPWKP